MNHSSPSSPQQFITHDSHTSKLNIMSFFDESTHTVTYIVHDISTRKCAIIDSVMGYNSSTGQTNNTAADRLINVIETEQLDVEWILETHLHADHFSAASYLQEHLGGTIAIGEHIPDTQKVFGELLNAEEAFKTDGSQFGRLFKDGDHFKIGNVDATVIAVPGHTPACIAYYIDDALFVGDTFFMPDYGSARCDFPGGDAGLLYDSIQKLYALPGNTRMFICHDYKAEKRDYYAWETTIDEQKANNIHLRDNTTRQEFVKMRTARDKTLPMPKLIYPSIQINMRAGQFPSPEDNGQRYLKIPLNSN